MGGDEEILARLEVGNDLLEKIRDCAFCGHRQTLSVWWCDVVRAPPDVDLFGAVNLCRFGFVEAL